MNKYILIAEKPSLCKQIKEVYYKFKKELDYEIVEFCAQAGFLYEEYKPEEYKEDLKVWKWEDLPFYPSNYGGQKFKPIKGKENLINTIKKAINENPGAAILHCGDYDASGESLVNLTLKMLRYNGPVKRFATCSLTEPEILKALKNLRDDRLDPEFIALQKSADARAYLDYEFGLNMTRACSLKSKQTIPVGRVMSPILTILAKREKEIQNYKEVIKYGIDSNYLKGFTGSLFNEEGDVKFETEVLAKDFIKTLSNKAVVKSFDKKQVKEKAPDLFKLTTLQIAAGKKLGWGANKTLEVLQTLYLDGLSSYPRSTCSYLPKGMNLQDMINTARVFDDLVPFINKITPDDINRIENDKSYVNQKKVDEASHFAITNTTKKADLSKMTKDQIDLYKIICESFLAIFLEPLIQEKIILITENNSNTFKTNGKKIISKGFTELLTSNIEETHIPDLKVGDILEVKNNSIREIKSTPPKRFDDTLLLQAMENPAKYLNDEKYKKLGKSLHLGMPSTVAGILEKIEVRDKVIERKKGKGKTQLIYVTPLGMSIYERFGNTKLFQVDMTGELEENLELIRRGELELETFYLNCKKALETSIEEIKNSSISVITASKNTICNCPVCNGSILPGEKSYYCSEWKNSSCSFSVPKSFLGANISTNDIIKLSEGKKIKKKLSKNDNSWDQELILNKETGKLEFYKSELDIVCPKCNSALTETPKGFMCKSCFNASSYEYFFNKEFNGTKISKSDLKKMLLGNKIKKKMLSKAGKEYEAYLSVKNGKYSMDFDKK